MATIVTIPDSPICEYEREHVSCGEREIMVCGDGGGDDIMVEESCGHSAESNGLSKKEELCDHEIIWVINCNKQQTKTKTSCFQNTGDYNYCRGAVSADFKI